MPMLVSLLSAPQPDINCHVLSTLNGLCEDYDGRAQLMAAQPAEVLLSLLDSDYRHIQELALAVVAKASRNHQCRQQLCMKNIQFETV